MSDSETATPPATPPASPNVPRRRGSCPPAPAPVRHFPHMGDAMKNNPPSTARELFPLNDADDDAE